MGSLDHCLMSRFGLRSDVPLTTPFITDKPPKCCFVIRVAGKLLDELACECRSGIRVAIAIGHKGQSEKGLAGLLRGQLAQPTLESALPIGPRGPMGTFIDPRL